MPARFGAAPLFSAAIVLIACSSESAVASSHTLSHARQLTLSATSANDFATESHSGSLQPLPPPSTAAPNGSSVAGTRTRARRPPTPAPAGGVTRTRLRYITASVSLASSDSVSVSASSGLRGATVSPSAASARPPAPAATTTQAPSRPAPRPAPPNSSESVSPSNVEGTASVPVTGGPTVPGSTAAVDPASTTPGAAPTELTTAAPPPTALPPSAPRTHTAAAGRAHTVTPTAADAETLSVSKLPSRSRPAVDGTTTPAAGLTTNAAPATTVRPPPPTDARTTLPPVAPHKGTRAAAHTLSPTAADAETLSVSKPLPQTVTTTALPDRGKLPPAREGHAAADRSDVPVIAAGVGAALVAVLVGVIVILVAVPALLRSWRRRRQSGGGKESPELPMEDRTNKYRWYDDAEAVAGDVEARTVPDLLPGATAMLLQVPVPSGAPLAGDGAFLPAVTGTVVAPPIPYSEARAGCVASAALHQAVKKQQPANPLPDMSML